MKKKRATIIDIAKESGFSKTTISFAFNNPDRIGKESYKKIMDTAKKLDYIPNPAGRNFSLKKRGTIGFLLPQVFNNTLSNPYINLVIKGIGSVCEKNKYNLTLIPPMNDSLSTAAYNTSVDGFIAMGLNVNMEVSHLLERLVIPLVTIDGTPDKNMYSVNINDEEASYMLMKKVLDAGHKNITIIRLDEDAFYTQSNQESSPEKRMKGFEKALKEKGLSIDCNCINTIISGCSFNEGLKTGKIILKDFPNTTAIVSMSDIITIGVMTYIKEQNIKIPADISIVSMDNIEESLMITPHLTTVNQPGCQKGEVAAKMLFNLINDKTVEKMQVTMPYSIIDRGSLANIY